MWMDCPCGLRWKNIDLLYTFESSAWCSYCLVVTYGAVDPKSIPCGIPFLMFLLYMFGASRNSLVLLFLKKLKALSLRVALLGSFSMSEASS